MLRRTFILAAAVPLLFSGCTSTPADRPAAGTTSSPVAAPSPAAEDTSVVPSGKWVEPKGGIDATVEYLSANGYEQFPPAELRATVIEACNHLGDGGDPVDAMTLVSGKLRVTDRQSAFVLSSSVVGACPQFQRLLTETE